MNCRRNVPFAIGLLLAASFATQADQVDDYIKGEMKKRQIPGLTIAVVKNGEVIKQQGYGLANVELNVPVRPDTVFDLASMTKQFTASAIMLLVEEGEIGLDDKICKYITKAPESWSSITVRRLLTHTAGLRQRDVPTIDRDTWLPDYTTAQMFEYASKQPLDFAPGERWQYSDLGYFLLGMIIEKVSGKRYREFLAERFFEPLGMNATTLLDQWEIVKNRADGYTLRNGKLARSRRYSQIELSSAYGVLSTVKDLEKWDTALSAGKVLKKSSVEQMWTPVKLHHGSNNTYGFGWFLDEVRGHRVVEHSGGTGTNIFRLPDDDLTVIVLTNLVFSNPRAIAQGVAGRYVPGLLLSSLEDQPDPNPQITEKMRKVLWDIANDVKDLPLMIPEVNARLTEPFIRALVASWLKALKSFTLVVCDDVEKRQIDRNGARISRIFYYKLLNAQETLYLPFYFTSDGRVADIQPPTEQAAAP